MRSDGLPADPPDAPGMQAAMDAAANSAGTTRRTAGGRVFELRNNVWTDEQAMNSGQ